MCSRRCHWSNSPSPPGATSCQKASTPFPAMVMAPTVRPGGLRVKGPAWLQCAKLDGIPEPIATATTAAPARGALLRSLFGSVRLAYVPVLVTYFCYGASGITSIALLYFQKDALGITPAEAAAIAFWVALPWSTKMVAGVASDVHPIFGRRRVSYLLLGALLTFGGYGWLATTASTKGTYLAAMVIIAVGFMVQDVVADALSVELARTDEEVKQIQTLGRMALLAGTISVGYLSGRLAGLVGLGYAALGVALEALSVPFGQEIILVVSGGLIVMLLQRVGISRAVAVAASASGSPARWRSPPSPSSASGPSRHPGRGSATGRSIGSASI